MHPNISSVRKAKRRTQQYAVSKNNPVARKVRSEAKRRLMELADELFGPNHNFNFGGK